MNGWKECKLREHVLINARSIDKYYPYKEIEYLDTGSITEGKIDSWQNFNLKDAPSRARRIVKDNDIVLSMVRPIQRHYGFISKTKPNSVVSTGFVVLTAKDSIEPFYLYSFLTQDDITEYLDVVAEGSTSAYPAFTPDVVEKLPILLPPLSEQRAIAGVLSSLDDKIDLLHRQNKTLEGMAETIFRQWFLEEENNREIVCLKDYVNCINGVSYKSSELNPSKNALVTLKSFNRHGGFSIDGFKEFTGNYKEQQVVLEGDLVVAHTDITQEADVLGNPALTISSPYHETLVISMDLVKVVPKVDWLSTEFLYFLMRSREFKHHCLGCANGTTVLHLNKEAIPTFEFSTPDKGKVIEFSEQAKKLIQQVFIQHKQLRTLNQLRDTLLPKLMTGEVRVKL